MTRTAQAEVYEMKTEERPEITMAVIIELRCSIGKFLATLADDQSSMNREATSRIGIVRRLL